LIIEEKYYKFNGRKGFDRKFPKKPKSPGKILGKCCLRPAKQQGGKR
jgi:hypothetical protein